MNTVIRTAFFAALFLGALPAARADGFVKVEQTIYGMDCAPCAYSMQKNLGKLPGVAKVDVSIEQGVAVIDFAPDSTTTLAQIREVVLHGGLTADKTVLTVQGTVAESGGRLLLTDGSKEQYALTGLSPAQSAALKPGLKIVVQGEVNVSTADPVVTISVQDVKTL